MNAPHYQCNSKMRSVLFSLIWAGFVSVGTTGCGSNMDTHSSYVTLGQHPALQGGGASPGVAGPSGPLSPELTVTAITHLMTIESDVAGRATLPIYFNVELLVDANNSFELLNVHRQGTTRPALPSTGAASASERARICAENSQASQENCDADLRQLVHEGIVIERFLGRAGVVLRAEEGFSPTDGGRLVVRYTQKANLSDSTQDTMAEYKIRLQHLNGQWLLISELNPDKGPFTLMKMASDFSGLFATGVKSIQVGTSDQSLW